MRRGGGGQAPSSIKRPAARGWSGRVRHTGEGTGEEQRRGASGGDQSRSWEAVLLIEEGGEEMCFGEEWRGGREGRVEHVFFSLRDRSDEDVGRSVSLDLRHNEIFFLGSRDRLIMS